MKVNADRLWNLHMKAATFTEADFPYTRRSFTPEHRDIRQWLTDAFREIGLDVKTDAAGNLLGIFEGGSDRMFAVGSHTDTVPGGGRFDGITGVLSFLEAVRCIKEAGFKPRKSIVGIDFLAEEPSEFSLSCIGSRLATGNFTEEMLQLKHRKTGAILMHEINAWGVDSSLLTPGRPLFDIDRFEGFLELHIEQGPILERQGMDIGLVTGICSVTRYDCTVHGRADHAGNTPMDMRSDAVVAAARLIDGIASTARRCQSKGPYFTATVGKVDVYPNASNVIAEKVVFTLDMRSEDNALVEESLVEIFAMAGSVAEQTSTTVNWKKISQGSPSLSDARLLAVLAETARKLGLKHQTILSGAGHDAAYMSKIMPMAMIFIPCRDGRSHTASEYSSKEQVARGADLLLHALVSLVS